MHALLRLIATCLLLLPVIGGAATVGGAVVGAVVMHGLPELMKGMPVVGEIPGVPLLIVGILMVIMLIFYPRGLIHIPRDIANFFQKRTAHAKKGEA